MGTHADFNSYSTNRHKSELLSNQCINPWWNLSWFNWLMYFSTIRIILSISLYLQYNTRLSLIEALEKDKQNTIILCIIYLAQTLLVAIITNLHKIHNYYIISGDQGHWVQIITFGATIDTDYQVNCITCDTWPVWTTAGPWGRVEIGVQNITKTETAGQILN